MSAISVVIPLYNKRDTIVRAIKSIANQTYVPCEIIVVNDGSSDDSAMIVKSLNEPKVKLINKLNEGVSSARNRGIKEAKCELIAFLDADDAWEPKFLETIFRMRKKYPKAGAYATSYARVLNNGVVIKMKPRYSKDKPYTFLIDNYFSFNKDIHKQFCTDSIAVKKNVFNKIGGFKENLNSGEDREMWTRIALNYEIAYCQYVGALYYSDYGEKKWFNRNVQHIEPEMQTILDFLKKGKKISGKQELFDYIDNLRINHAKKYLFNNQSQKAQSILRQIHPTSKFIWFQKHWWLVGSMFSLKILYLGVNFKKILREIFPTNIG